MSSLNPFHPSLKDRVLWWATHPKAALMRVAGEFHKWSHPNEPWISQHAVRFCDEHLRENMQGLEWGSGRSTAWYAKRLKALLSVEHAEGWHKEVTEKLKNGGHKNVDYRYIPLDHPVQEPTHRDYNPLPRYVKVVEEFAPNSLDFVVVDGHYRLACIQAVMPRLKPGGLLLVDNSNWMPLVHWGVPAEWKIVHRSMGYEGETTIWKKP